jgi:hypothetical protein
MIRTDAAYKKLAVILGSKIISRSKTLKEYGQPTKVFSQTLLLIPTAKASALTIPDAEVYIDKTTKEEFVATVISQTKPRNKVRVAALPCNPMMEWRPVLGQSGFCEGKHLVIVCTNINCLCKELMAQVFVKITHCCPLSQFRYGQIVSQLVAYNENQRLGDIFATLRKLGSPAPSWSHFLAFVAATEADSIKLVSHTDVGVQIQISATQVKTWRDDADDDSSVHSTIPLNARPSTKPADMMLNINSKLRDTLDIEFEAKFQKFNKRLPQDRT